MKPAGAFEARSIRRDEEFYRRDRAENRFLLRHLRLPENRTLEDWRIPLLGRADKSAALIRIQKVFGKPAGLSVIGIEEHFPQVDDLFGNSNDDTFRDKHRYGLHRNGPGDERYGLRNYRRAGIRRNAGHAANRLSVSIYDGNSTIELASAIKPFIHLTTERLEGSGLHFFSNGKSTPKAIVTPRSSIGPEGAGSSKSSSLTAKMIDTLPEHSAHGSSLREIIREGRV